MPDDTIKNQRPGKCEDAYGNACQILCSKSSRSLKKRSAYTSCRSSSMRLMIGEREGGGGIWNAEFGIRNSESRTARQYRIPSRAGKRPCGEKILPSSTTHTVARREAPLSEYGGRSYRSAIYAAQLPRPLRFMAGAANEALRIRPDGVRMVTSRARLRYMVECGPAARNQISIASDRLLPALNSDIWLSAGSAPKLE